MRFLLLWVSALAVTAAPADWQTLYSTGFDDGRADGWTWYSNIVNRWSWDVVRDEDNYVLSGSLVDGRSPATYARGAWSDFRLKARVKLLRGDVTLNFRYSRCAGYRLRLGAGAGQFSRQLDCAAPQRLPDHAGTLQSGRWYRVEVEGIGSNLKMWIDGTLVLDYIDVNSIPAGGFAFEAGQNSEVHIDNVEVTGPPDIHAISWVRTGGPLGGEGHNIRMSPADPDTLYLTDTFSGVSISTNGGLTWKTSNTGILDKSGSSGDSVSVYCLTVDPNDPRIVWAGAQGRNSLYRSADGGSTWKLRDLGVEEDAGITFHGITVHPRDSNVVYAAAEISSIIWAGEVITSYPFDHTMGVVYKSTNGGETWSAIWRGNNLAGSVWLDPRDPEVVYVSTGVWERMAADTDDAAKFAGGVGILKSRDGGATWRVLNEGNGLGNLYIGSLFLNPRNPDVLLAGAGNNRYGAGDGVYLSTDGGETWRKTLTSNMELTAVEFASSDPDIAYAASAKAFYRSTDAGLTWKTMSGDGINGALNWAPPGVRAGIPADMQVDPRNPDRVFMTSYVGGVFLTEDGGRTWVDASWGYTGDNLSSVAVDPKDHRRVYAVGRSGPFRSDDGGVNWQGLLYRPPNVADWFQGGWGFPEWHSVAVSPSDPRRVLISDEMTGTIFLGPNYGLDWKIVYHYPFTGNGPSTNQGFKALAFAPSDPTVVYAGMCNDCRQRQQPINPSGGIWKSTDSGESWGQANDSFTASLNIHALAADPRTSNIIYAGTGDHGVVRTLDGGASWEPCSVGLTNLDVRAVAVDPVEWWVMYAGTYDGGIYKSQDTCSGWQPANLGLDPAAKILSLVIDPNRRNVVFAADLRNGVYRSEDGGKFWTLLNLGLTTRAVRALALSADGGTLYAATEGEGIFRLDLLPFDR
jgi:photosystem II stability/assembly factor-like uncharacterized protein